MRPFKKMDWKDNIDEDKEYRQLVLKRLVTFSFIPVWEWLVEIVTVISIFNAVYVTFFDNSDENLFAYYYCLETIYLFDTAIGYIHRYAGVRKFTLNPPRNLFILAMDTLSLLPIYEFCFIAFPQWATPQLQRRQQLKSILRVYERIPFDQLGAPLGNQTLFQLHIIAYLVNKRVESAKVHIIMIKVTHVFLLLLMVLFITCWWSYEASCYPKCTEPNWTDSLPYLTTSNISEPLNWFLLCFTNIGDVLIHGSPGFLVDRNDTESGIFLASLIIGFTMHSCFEFAHIFNNYIFILETRYEYRLHLIRLRLLFDTCIENVNSDRAFAYYDMLWRKRDAVTPTACLIHFLPTTLIKEVMTDVFHEALNHSHLFRRMSFSLKKELCARMATLYFLPGDYLFQQDKPYARMIYLHSGVIQVISYEDYSTPILTLSDGTLLGEAALNMILKSSATVQCSSECEIKVLYMDDYARLSVNYSKEFRVYRQRIAQRVAFAREHCENDPRVKSMKRLKRQWRKMMELHVLSAKVKVTAKDLIENLDRNFLSRYLDLIVIKENNYIDNKVICLNAKCPFLMNPNSDLRQFFRYFHLVVAVFHALYLPYFYVFTGRIPREFYLINLFVDLVFFVDIYMQTITYVVDDRTVLSDFKKLSLYKFNQFQYLVDFFSALPYDYVGYIGAFNDQRCFYLRLPKIVQWYKLVELIITLEKRAVSQNILIIALKYFVLYFSVIYLSLCYHYLAFNFGQHGHDEASPNWPSSSMPILNCIIYNLSALCLLSISERLATTIHGMLLYTMCTFLGCLLMNFLLVELTAHIVKANQQKYELVKEYNTVHEFLISQSLAENYRSYLSAYYIFLWQYNKNINFVPDPVMPEYEIYINNMIAIIAQVPAFSCFSRELLSLIAARAVMRIHPPGFVLSKVGDRNIHLHIITKGYCSMSLFVPGDREKNLVKTLQPGDCFNFLEVMHSLNSFNTTITITAVEEVSISACDVFDMIKTDKIEMDLFNETLEWHIQKYRTILHSHKHSDFLISSTRNVLPAKRVAHFTYAINDDFQPQEERDPFTKQYSVLTNFLLQSTINPDCLFFILWEMFRSSVAVCFSFVLMMRQTILFEHTVGRRVWVGCSSFVFLLDILIRFHVQYYNEENVRVTSIHNTAMYYMKTSMAMDVVAAIPVILWPLYIVGSYQFTLNVIVSLVYYSALLHRPFQGLVYITNNYKDFRVHIARCLYYCIFIIAFVCVIGNNMMVTVCTNERQFRIYRNCSTTQNYISTSPFANTTNPLHLLLFQVHAVSERLHSDFVGVSTYPLMDSVIESLIINMALWCFKLYLVARIISVTIGDNAVIVNKAKTNYNSFLLFVKNETVSEQTIDEVKEHFEYVESKNGGHTTNSLLSKLSDNVRLDIKRHLFTGTLHRTQFFSTFSDDALRVFIEFFELVYFRIGADIIRCNDVQTKIYVVCKGVVDIIIANDQIASLSRGGMFGCFSEKGITRQTIIARANRHVELLVIDCVTLVKYLTPFPHLLHKLHAYIAQNEEYIDAISAVSAKDSIMSDRTRRSFRMQQFCYRFYDKFNAVIHDSSKGFKIYKMAHVHFAALSSIILIFLSFVRNIWYIASFCYVCDLFFWANMFLNFHLHYVNPETGIKITQPNLIRKRYAQSLEFWVTFLGSLPFEVISFTAQADSFYWVCCFSNRLIRFIIVVIYNYELKKKLTFSRVFRWLYLIYLFAFEVGLMSLIWNTVACHFETCMHRISSGPIKVMGVSEERDDILLSILYVIILFTAAGIRTVSSVTIAQVTVTMFISSASLVIASAMIGVLTSLLIINDIPMNRYKEQVEKMKKYFCSLDLSPYLQRKLSDSMGTLWMRRRGELLPNIIANSPPHIQQNVMASMYGHHLQRHRLFGRMHADMLRQMCVLFKVGLYTPGQRIASTGDMDDCIYFLHHGQIRIVDEETNNACVISQNYSFGEEQSLYNQPHRHTYIAYTTIDLLLLERGAWAHLIDWFPAAKEIIAKARRHATAHVVHLDA